jgi:carbon monoxide dehydrogenase subunit G
MVTNYNEIEIAAPPEKVFAYVTRPDLWHEWHPASTSAELPRIPLQAGDSFREIITVSYPLAKIRRQTEYRVVLSKPNQVWEVSGESSLFDLTIHYEFRQQGKGTLFQRTLTYAVKGPLRYLEPLLIRPKIRRQSATALRNLSQKLAG